MKTEVKKGQSLLDIAVQHCGAAHCVWEIARKNSLEISADLSVGQILEIPGLTDDFGDKKMVKKLAAKDAQPATAAPDDFINEIFDPGIGEMIIETNFI